MERDIDASLKLGKGNEIMEEYINDATNASRDELLLEAYDKEWALKDEGLREGYEDGFEKGHKDGFQQGIQQGARQGIEKTKSEIICNMLKENMQ